MVFMLFYGYKKGFITRLYDVLTTILVIFLTCLLTGPISNIWIVYKYNTQDLISTVVGTAINFFVVFILLFVILFIIKKIIGLFIKPILKKLMDKFKVTAFVNKTLGVILSLIEGIAFSYIILVFIFIPFQSNGTTMLQETLVAKHVVDIVPSVTSSVIGLKEVYLNTKDDTNSFSLQSLTQMLLMADSFNLLDNEQIQIILKDNILKELENDYITVSAEEKIKIQDLLTQTGYNNAEIEKYLSHINVSGE